MIIKVIPVRNEDDAMELKLVEIDERHDFINFADPEQMEKIDISKECKLLGIEL